MNEPLVTYTVDGPVGIVSLNRPEKLNALSYELVRQLRTPPQATSRL